jgi:TolB-like protein/DNA-binding winged helix-turn-helix (wHTH) protein/Tfp pilus assembly protein PilF
MARGSKRFYQFGPYRIDPDRSQLLRDDQPVPLTSKAFETLLILVEHSQREISKDELMRRVWPDTFVEEANLAKHISMVRKALGETAQHRRYIVTLPGRGYRFAEQVLVVPHEGTESVLESHSRSTVVIEESEPQLGQFSGLPKSRLWALVALVLLALSGAVLLLTITGFRDRLRTRLSSKSADSSASQLRSVAVLLLENLSGDTEQEYFAEGLTDELTSRLATLPGIRVISRTSAIQYKSTGKTAPQIGKELGVDALLVGTLERVGKRVRLRVQLVRAATDQHLWAESYDYHLGDVLALETDFARDVAGKIRVQLTTQEASSIVRNVTVNPAAFEAYLKGRYFWNKRDGGGLKKAIEYFHQAILADPTYAPAYADLAQSYILLSDPVRAKSAAEKALSLNPALAEAHTALGLIDEEFWDFPDAEKEYKLAIDLNPNYATAHHWYGEGYLLLMGRFVEADREMTRAHALDPVSRIVATDWGAVLYYEQHYEEAYQELTKVLEMEPGFSEALMYRGLVLLRQRRYGEAVADLEHSARIDGGPKKLGVLGWGLGVAGKRSQANTILRKLKAMSQQSTCQPGP